MRSIYVIYVRSHISSIVGLFQPNFYIAIQSSQIWSHKMRSISHSQRNFEFVWITLAQLDYYYYFDNKHKINLVFWLNQNSITLLICSLCQPFLSLFLSIVEQMGVYFLLMVQSTLFKILLIFCSTLGNIIYATLAL